MVVLSENALKVLNKRFFKRDNNKEIIEGWPELCNRVVSHILSKDSRKDDFFDKFYNMMLNIDFLPNSPTMFNAGSNKSTLSACFYFEMDDDMGSIMETLCHGAMIQKWGGGVGYNFSKIRPEGNTVKTTGGAASGPISFMCLYSASGKTVTQSGKRDAAMLAGLDISHPDIEKFLSCKKVEGKLANFNISVFIDDKFMEAVKNNKSYDLVFDNKVYKTVSAKRLMNKIVSNSWQNGEPGVIFMGNVERKDPLRKVLPITGCNPCWSGDTTIAVADGRIGVTIKQLAEEGKDVPVYCYGNSNNQIRLGRQPRKTGTKQLYKVTLDDGSSLRLTGDHKWILSDFSNKTTLELKRGDSLLRFDRGPSHKWWKQKTNEYYETVMGELEHRKIAEFYEGRTLKSYPEEIVHHKDNNIYNNSIDNLEIMSLVEHNTKHYKNNSFGSKNANSNRIANTTKYIELFMNLIQLLNRMPLKSEFIDACRESRLGRDFVWGRVFGSYEDLKNYFFYSDVYRNTSQYLEAKEIEVICDYTGKKFRRRNPKEHTRDRSLIKRNFIDLRAYRSYVEFFDVPILDRNQGLWYAPHLRNMYRTAINNQLSLTYENWDSNKEFFEKEYGIHVEKKVAIQIYPDIKELGLASSVGNHAVISIEEDGIEDVYNITVDEFHNVAILTKKMWKDKKRQYSWSGIYVTQCAEQVLAANESCNLGSINLFNMTIKADDGYFIDWNKLSNIISLAVRFLDDVIDVNDFPIDKIKTTTELGRKIGLGLMGWADLLYKLKIRYGSEESFDLAKKVMGFIQYVGLKTSIKLAKEKGKFPLFDDADFSFILDYENFDIKVSEVMHDDGDREYRYSFNAVIDWNLLYSDIQKFGLRNATITTLAPTGSLSIIANTSGGIEPNFNLAYYKNVIGTKLFVLNPVFEEIVKEYNLDKSILNRVASGESILNISEIPDELKISFVVSSDICANDHIKMQASFQQYTSNAISKTINFSSKATKKDIYEAIISAYDMGCKGLTVYRDKSREKQVFDNILTNNYDVPELLSAKRVKIETPNGKAFLIVSLYNDKPYEVYFFPPDRMDIDMNAWIINVAICRCIAMGLQGRKDLVEYVNQLKKALRFGSDFTLENVVSSLEKTNDVDSILSSEGDKISSLALHKIISCGISNEEITLLDYSEELNDIVKNNGSISSVVFHLVRSLRKVIEKLGQDNGEDIYLRERCPDCGSRLILSEGCSRCPECLMTYCG